MLQISQIYTRREMKTKSSNVLKMGLVAGDYICSVSKICGLTNNPLAEVAMIDSEKLRKQLLWWQRTNVEGAHEDFE